MRTYHPMAVDRLLSSSNGHIPPAAMAAARAADAVFMEQNPDWYRLTDAQRTAIFCRTQVRLLIGAFRGRKAVNARLTRPDDYMVREIAHYRRNHRLALRAVAGAA